MGGLRAGQTLAGAFAQTTGVIVHTIRITELFKEASRIQGRMGAAGFCMQ
jgi:hypothetical protein